MARDVARKARDSVRRKGTSNAGLPKLADCQHKRERKLNFYSRGRLSWRISKTRKSERIPGSASRGTFKYIC